MSILPLDLALEIFSALPVKSLLRFRCVSKLICSELDSQEFIDRHLRRALTRQTNNYLIIQCGYRKLPIMTFMVDSDSLKKPVASPSVQSSIRSETIFGCCNGLVALYTRITLNGRLSARNLALWNPSTREYRMLPNIEQLDDDFWSHFLGFGYDRGADDYKVVLWKNYPEISRGTLVIYSLKTGSWTMPITIDFPGRAVFQETCGVFYKSSFHWTVYTRNDRRFWIAYFNLEREEFQMIPLDHLRQDGTPQVFVYERSICVHYIFYERGLQANEYWMMKEYGAPTSFTKISPVGDTFFVPNSYALYPGKALEEGLNKKRFLWCDFENQRYEQVKLPDGAPAYFSTTICVNSLVRLG